MTRPRAGGIHIYLLMLTLTLLNSSKLLKTPRAVARAHVDVMID